MSELDYKDAQGWNHRFCSKCNKEIDLLDSFYRLNDGKTKYYHDECKPFDLVHFEGTRSK